MNGPSAHKPLRTASASVEPFDAHAGPVEREARRARSRRSSSRRRCPARAGRPTAGRRWRPRWPGRRGACSRCRARTSRPAASWWPRRPRPSRGSARAGGRRSGRGRRSSRSRGPRPCGRARGTPSRSRPAAPATPKRNLRSCAMARDPRRAPLGLLSARCCRSRRCRATWSSRSSTTCHSIIATEVTTSCAMRSPRWISYGSVGSVLTSRTLSSPRYSGSMRPGVFRQVTPCLSASPDRGSTSPAYPDGMATATPVGTSARPPRGSSTTDSRACRS